MGKITVRTSINADIQKVWNYYTAPEHITQWNFALDSWHCPKAINDLIVGGRFVSRMEAKDGSAGFDFEGSYKNILFGERIEYIIGDDREVIIEFEDKGNNKIDVFITFDSEDENPIEMQQEGWQNILDNFKKHVEYSK